MTKLSTIIFVLSMAIVPSAYSAEMPPKPQTHFGFEDSDWKKEPFEFLAFLIRQHDRGAVMVTLNIAPRDWIKKEHIGLLMLLLDSKEPCAPVYSAASSGIPPGMPGVPGSKAVKSSTVGHEAAYLIASYRRGPYPNSVEVSSDLEFDLAEIKRWWEEEQKR